LGVRGPKSKILRTTFCRVPHGELTAKTGSITSRNKKRRNLKFVRQTDRHPDRQTESMLTIMTPRLGAEINNTLAVTIILNSVYITI